MHHFPLFPPALIIRFPSFSYKEIDLYSQGWGIAFQSEDEDLKKTSQKTDAVMYTFLF